MRVALKIAYDGSRFFGHQRQPDARTVEGECLFALREAKVLGNPQEAFFRSASRTDRGVSAIGNVIAFDTTFPLNGIVGAFNDRARDVWAWAIAVVPDGFHPRHAIERWYRYHLFSKASIGALRRAARLFVGPHDFASFTSDPARGPLAIDRIDVTRSGRAILLDVRAKSFRRAMVRRIVSAAVRCASGEIEEADIRAALQGARRGFGVAPPEPLFLMDVRYSFEMQTALKPKVLDEWRAFEEATELGHRFVRAMSEAAGILRASGRGRNRGFRSRSHGGARGAC